MHMTIRTIILTSLLLYTGGTQASGPGEVFTPKDRSFTVKFPGPPKCKSEPVDMPGETIEMHMCVFADEAAQLFYGLTYFNRPKSSLGVDDKTALRGARDGSLAMSNSQLISEREITVDGYPGLESVHRARDIEISSTTRHIITKRQLVFVDISGQPGKVPNSVVRAYLDSLRFTSNQSSAPVK